MSELPVTEERMTRIKTASGGRLGDLEAARLCGILDHHSLPEAQRIVAAAYGEGLASVCEDCGGSRVIARQAGDGGEYEEPCACVGKIE